MRNVAFMRSSSEGLHTAPKHYVWEAKREFQRRQESNFSGEEYVIQKIFDPENTGHKFRYEHRLLMEPVQLKLRKRNRERFSLR